jgi:fumarylacetoacetase
MINAATHPHLRAWISVAPQSDFPIQNMPFGVFQTAQLSPRLASIIGDQVIDLAALVDLGYLDLPLSVVQQPSLNPFIALGKERTGAVRHALIELFSSENGLLRDRAEHRAKVLHDLGSVELCMPIQVGDYTDFYSSREHATNVGIMFRDPNNALLPNWLHLPVGYHGRSSSIVVSGTPVRRPKGQTRPNDAEPPVFGPSKQLDFELEVAFVVGRNTEMGQSIPVNEAEEYIFGLLLFNDWSARDLQKWEYVPLGPFLGKNFASTVSPWVVVLEALEPFRTAGPVQEPQPLPYLQYEGKGNFDLNLEVYLQPEGGAENLICRSNFKYMYWNMAQQLAHHTVNGCNVRIGDLCASGTISGPTPDSYGSMLELAWKGTKPLRMSDGTERKFIADGDTLTLRGFGEYQGLRIGFGEASGKVLPAL